MGQKVNPIGIRLGITRDWSSKWYAHSKNFASNIHTDFLVRKYLNKKLADASVSNIHIERAARRANITIHTARPGIVIGKKGEDIEKLRTAVAKILGMGMNDVRLNIAEIRKPELDAKLVASSLGFLISAMFRRTSFMPIPRLGDGGAELLDVLALLADHDSRPRGMNGDVRAPGGPLDVDVAHRRIRQFLVQKFAHQEIGVDVSGKILRVRIPLRRPVARDA